MKKILLLVIILLSFSAKSQSIVNSFYHGAYGGDSAEWCYAMQQTADSGYILAGETQRGGWPNWEMFVVKIDKNGNELWNRTYGLSNRDEANSIQETADHGFIITGYITDASGFPANMALIKTDSLGNIEWSRNYGNSNTGVGHFVEQTNDGGYIVQISYQNTGTGLLKTDSLGNILWTKIYLNNIYSGFVCVRETNDGGFISTGNIQGTTGRTVQLLKTDSAGNVLWSRIYYNNIHNSYGKYVEQTNDGGYVVTGYSRGLITEDDRFFILKADSGGNLSWFKEYDYDGGDRGNSVHQTLDNGYILSGYGYASSSDDGCLVKTDSMGSVTWAMEYGTQFADERIYQVVQTFDGEYAASGVVVDSLINNNFWSIDFYLIKTDSLGYSGCSLQPAVVNVVTYPITDSIISTTDSSIVFSSSNTVLNVGAEGTDTLICSLIVTGFVTAHQPGFKIFPNPSGDLFNISIPVNDFRHATLKIYNTLGSLVKEQRITSENTVITREGMSNGIYFVVVNNGERQWVGKMVVE
jgi:hypothetical protein